ncbi:MAG: DUF1800 domain-containing protein [Isosphaeraceae bacterium]
MRPATPARASLSGSLWNDPARAWAVYEPSQASPWDLARVGHLHRRAGFAAPWAVLQRDLREGPQASVDRLLDGETTTPDGRSAAAFEALAENMSRQLAPGASLTRLQGLWIYRLVFTPHPLRERMTLFWHNHFATSQTKVQNTALMQRQIDFFRGNALGNFRTILEGVGKDPAMLIWLDSTENRRAHPNENYAREVMELFALGRGKYTEKDIQEAARAFTGWFVVRDQFQEIAGQHDDGPKHVLGKSGRFDGDDIPPLLLEQPACAEFLATKLIRMFVSEVDPIPPPLVAPLADALRAANYNIRVPIEMILRSNLFFDHAARRRRVKSPVELTVGTIRALEIVKPTVQADAVAEACGRMGQGLYAPPSVAGWEGGSAWINSTAMLARSNFALGLLSPESAALGRRFDPADLVRRHGAKDAARFFGELLVQDAFDATVAARVAASSATPREAATYVLTSPEYQLA